MAGETLAGEVRFGAAAGMKEAEVGDVKVRVGVAAEAIRRSTRIRPDP